MYICRTMKAVHPHTAAPYVFQPQQASVELAFGNGGRGPYGWEGWMKYGPYRPMPDGRLTVVPLYPRGWAGQVEGLMELLQPLERLTGQTLHTDRSLWVEYDADHNPLHSLAKAFCQSRLALQPDSHRLYCLLFAPHEAGSRAAAHTLSPFVGRWAATAQACYWGPVPLPQQLARLDDRWLYLLGAELMTAYGGVPYVPAVWPAEELAMAVSRLQEPDGSGYRVFGTFYDKPEQLCHHHFLHPESRAAATLVARLQTYFACRLTDVRTRHVVLYCHHQFPAGLLAPAAGWCRRLPEQVEFVVARVGRNFQGASGPPGSCLRIGPNRYRCVEVGGPYAAIAPWAWEVEYSCLNRTDWMLQPGGRTESELLLQLLRLMATGYRCCAPMVWHYAERRLRQHLQRLPMSPADLPGDDLWAQFLD